MFKNISLLFLILVGCFFTTGVFAQCSPGQYNSGSGSVTCMECEAGTFSTTSDATHCETCPDMMTSTAGSSECEKTGGAKDTALLKRTPVTETNTTTSDSTNDNNSSSATSYTLTEMETTILITVAQRIILLIETNRNPTNLYQLTLALLNSSLAKYVEENDIRKTTIINDLLELLEGHFS